MRCPESNVSLLRSFLCAATLAVGSASAALTATFDYTASDDPDGGSDSSWEDSLSVGHDFLLDTGVSYNGSPSGAPSGVSAVYSFDGSGSRFNSRAAWGTNDNIENIGSGNPTGQSATFELVFRADTDTRQEILWEMGGSGRGASMTLNEGVLQFAERSSDAIVTASVSAGAFYHVVGVLDMNGDLMSLYVNGASPVSTAYGSTDWSGTDGGTDGALGGQNGSTVGGQNNDNGIGSYSSFDGDIAVFRLYANQVATQSDVDGLFAATGIVPEPSSLALVLLGGLALFRRVRP